MEAKITRFELWELIRTNSLSLVLGKRLAIFLVVFSILIVLVAWFGAVLLLINAQFDLLGLEGISPIGALGRVIGVAFLLAVIPGLVTYFALPKIYDRDLEIQTELPAEECSSKLRRLTDAYQGWRRDGLIRKHADVFVSEKIQSNVVTYGNFDRARIVFARDVLEQMSFTQLRAILAHETGHVVENDYVVTCLFSEITKILDYLRKPFDWLCLLVAMLFRMLARLPIGILRYVLLALDFLIRFVIHLLTLPLWMPRVLLYWESHLAEYLADDFGVALGGSASGLITALMKLENMRVTIGRSGFPRRYDLFATVVEHGHSLETNTVVGDIAQFLRELKSSHPHSVRRWNRLARLGFLDARVG